MPDGRRRFHSLVAHIDPREGPIGEGFRVFATATGALFVTQNAVLSWDGQAFSRWSMPGTRRLIASRAGEHVLVHYAPDGLYAFSAAGRELLIPKATLGDAVVFWAEQRRDHWLLSTTEGLFVWRGERLEPFAPEVAPWIRANALTSTVKLADGRLALGSLRDGLVILSATGQIERFLRADDGLGTMYVAGLFVDRDGALWVNTRVAIVRIDAHLASTFLDEHAGLPQVSVRKITAAAGQIVALNEAGVFRWDAERGRFFAIPELQGVWDDIEGSPAGLLASGYHQAVHWNGDRLQRLRQTLFDVVAVTRSRHDPASIYVAENRSVLRLAPDGTETVVLRDLPVAAAAIVDTPDGRVWAGSVRGIFVSTGEGRFERPDANPASQLPPINGPATFRVLSDGTLALITTDGVWTRRDGEQRFVPVPGGRIDRFAAISPVTPDDTFWLVTQNDATAAYLVCEFSLAGGEARLRPHEVDSLSNLDQVHSIFAERDARSGQRILWIGGRKGVLRHELKTPAPLAPPRAPQIRAYVKAGSPAIRTLAGAVVPYDARAIELEFATHEFSRRSLTRLETRVDGIDDHWMPIGSDARRELTASRDGHYTVRARTVSPAGATSAETILPLQVLPPWWRTRPTLGSAALAVALLGYLGYRVRVRALRAQNARLEDKVRERTEQLEAANAAKTQFVANMSHDIRNPINGIVGLALALEDTRLDPKQRELVATMRECTNYLSSLVDDVLDFASIEAGRVELRPGAFSPVDLLQSVVTAMKGDAAERGAALSFEIAPDLPRSLMGDAGRIQQILVNYASNAVKYAGGAVALAARVPADSPGEIEFSVTDHGPGIAEAEKKTLFTKFSRLEKARREHVPGTGLGLASCRLLADLMGGSVDVRSAPGEGACFTLRLPLAVAEEIAPANTAALPHTTVLLVEDTDYNALAATAVLARLGLKCERARTGTEALQLFGEKRFNVVLLDRNLPDMDGLEVARSMRQMETEGRQAVLLAVTAYCTAEDRERCLAAGMDAFVGKPLTPDKLRRVLIEAGRKLLASASVQVAPEIPAPAETAAAAGLNTELLALMADDEAGLPEQVERYIEVVQDCARQLADASATGDFQVMGQTAHVLRAQARIVQSGPLLEAAAGLEDAARSHDRPACATFYDRVLAEVRVLTEALRRHPSSARPA
jgi:signal transduction histidine kinase/DNA-binding NarL/FixJ family response regulator